MEIILKQDVANLGHENDIVIVKNGYARNYLIPQGMAALATDINRKILAENLKQKSHKIEKIKNEANLLAGKLNDITVKLATKVSESGKIYGSVNNIQIAEAILAQYGIELDRKKIHIDGANIKEIGTYTASVSIHKDVKATINVEVVAEEA